MLEWLRYVKTCSEKYNIDPNFALAVAETESSTKEVRFRFGKMGRSKYYGPFGIHKCFLKKWNINDPFVNTEVGIRALARYGPGDGNYRRALKKYNATFNEAYYRRIKELQRRNKSAKVFESKQLIITKR
jgi:soluble lytic murein transglycosylase-like protein